jgi:hypothetical protein
MKARTLLVALLASGSIAVVATSQAQPKPPVALEGIKLAQDDGYRVKGETTFFYRGEFMIDADGAPTAYHPGYTCDASYKKGWKQPTKIDCSARTTKNCRTRGFKDDPAPGTQGTYTRCRTAKVSGKWVCTDGAVKKMTQGGCTQDSSANSGLDYLANAGEPGNFYGIVTDKNGEPYVQGPKDVAPGYYISATSLANPSYKESNPLRFVDSTKINYIALPQNSKLVGAKLGDYGLAINWKTGKQGFAVFADVGGNADDEIGEGSIALAAALGVSGNPKGGGGDEDIVYVVFAGSSKGFPASQAVVDQGALLEFIKWGGPIKMMSVFPKDWIADYKKP